MHTSEELRSIYNGRYSTTDDKSDRWSLTHPIAASRVAKAVASMTGLKKGASILDVGCAKGFVSKAFFDQGYSVVGIDISDVAVGMAKEKNQGPVFLVQDGFDPSLDEHFDLILMRGFSGTNSAQVSPVADVLQRYKKLLTGNGCIVIQVPISRAPRVDSNWQPWSLAFIREIAETCSLRVDSVCYGDPAASLIMNVFRKMRFFLVGTPVNGSILFRLASGRASNHETDVNPASR